NADILEEAAEVRHLTQHRRSLFAVVARRLCRLSRRLGKHTTKQSGNASHIENHPKHRAYFREEREAKLHASGAQCTKHTASSTRGISRVLAPGRRLQAHSRVPPASRCAVGLYFKERFLRTAVGDCLLLLRRRMTSIRRAADGMTLRQRSP